MEPKLTVDEYGTKTWRLNGKIHREDGPAEEYADGTKRWYLDNKLHRTDGPAIEGSNGYRAWFLYGKYHRKDGPAIEWPDGDKWWYLNDNRLSKEDFTSIDQVIKMQALELLTPQEIVRLRSEA